MISARQLILRLPRSHDLDSADLLDQLTRQHFLRHFDVLEAVRSKYLGRQGMVTGLMRGLGAGIAAP